jgi:hypothetical protein
LSLFMNGVEGRLDRLFESFVDLAF